MAAVVLVVAGAWLGLLVADRLLDPSTMAEQPTPTLTTELPVVDVAGDDVSGLPRYPGAVRTAYDRERQGTKAVTAVDYVATAQQDDVRAFYRRVFREEGWELIELDFSGGEWVFLVEKGRRAAFVEIEDGGTYTIIQIEVERSSEAARPRPTPTPATQPPPRPPPGDDDDDDGDDDDGDD